MKKKIFVISCIMLVLLVALPSCTSQEIVHPTALLNSMTPAHVVIKGDSKEFFVGYQFVAGFGRCLAMVVNLKTTGHAEINKLFHPLQTVVLDGHGIILLIGFIGYLKMVDNGMNLNGVTALAVWL
jgi:hypothetical protein